MNHALHLVDKGCRLVLRGCNIAVSIKPKCFGHGGKRHALAVSLCGHAMHKSCLHRYIESLLSRRHQNTRTASREELAENVITL